MMKDRLFRTGIILSASFLNSGCSILVKEVQQGDSTHLIVVGGVAVLSVVGYGIYKYDEYQKDNRKIPREPVEPRPDPPPPKPVRFSSSSTSLAELNIACLYSNRQRTLGDCKEVQCTASGKPRWRTALMICSDREKAQLCDRITPTVED
ncbi:MAG: hypothetical protein Q7S14_02605 [bacterium]|nr:hypothetical protein [bacterium]